MQWSVLGPPALGPARAHRGHVKGDASRLLKLTAAGEGERLTFSDFSLFLRDLLSDKTHTSVRVKNNAIRINELRRTEKK